MAKENSDLLFFFSFVIASFRLLEMKFPEVLLWLADRCNLVRNDQKKNNVFSASARIQVCVWVTVAINY